MRKICFIIDSMKNSGGRERVVSLLSKEFIKKNIVKILVLDDNMESFYALDDNIEIFNVKGKNKLERLMSLHKFLKNNTEYIYITLSMRYLNLFVSAASIFTKSKIIATEHCDYFTTPQLFRAMKRIFYKKFKYVVTLTDKDKKILKKWLRNVEQINNPSSFHPESGSEYNNKIILNVGRLTEQKGQDMLLSAWAKSDKKDWKLIIVGDGELKNDLLQQIHKLNISDTVEIQEPTKEIEKIYLNSDIFVLSSRWEGLPMVLIEAMSCGLPCISFDCETGPRQLINDNYNGYLVKANDIDELSKSIDKLISNKELLIKFGKNSMIESKKYNAENISLEWYKLMDKLEK